MLLHPGFTRDPFNHRPVYVSTIHRAICHNMEKGYIGYKGHVDWQGVCTVEGPCELGRGVSGRRAMSTGKGCVQKGCVWKGCIR